VNSRIKKMEEEKLMELQNAGNQLRETRKLYQAAIDDCTALCAEKPMLEFLDEYPPVEAKLDEMIAQRPTQKVDLSTQFSINLEPDDVCKLLSRQLNATAVLPSDDQGFTLSAPPPTASSRRNTASQPKERRKIENAADVMHVLDDLNEQLLALQEEKSAAVAKEQWPEASAIVAEIQQIEFEIEKLEKDLLSVKKREAVNTQERELLAISLKESLVTLTNKKEALLSQDPIDYHAVADVVDELRIVQKEIEDNHIDEEPVIEVVKPDTNVKNDELRRYEQAIKNEESAERGSLFSFMIS